MLISLHVEAQPVVWTAAEAGVTGEIISIAVSAEDDIYIGTRNEGIYRSTDQGISWEDVTGDIPDDEIRSIIITPDGTILAGTFSGGVNRSTDDGNSWTQVTTGNSHRLAQAQDGTLYLSPSSGILRSTDDGATWQATDLDNELTVNAIAIAPNGDTYVTIQFDGDIYKTTDRGDTWENTSFGSVSDEFFIDALTVNSEGNVFVAGDASYASMDGGNTWDEIDIPGFFATWLFSSGTTVFAPGEDGVHRSTDNGATWELLDNGWVVEAGESTALTERDGALYAGTATGYVMTTSQSSSVHRSDDILLGDIITLTNPAPNPTSTQTSISYQLLRSTPIRISIIAEDGSEAALPVNTVQQAGHYRLELPVSSLPNGAYFVSILTDDGRLTRRFIVAR